MAEGGDVLPRPARPDWTSYPTPEVHGIPGLLTTLTSGLIALAGGTQAQTPAQPQPVPVAAAHAPLAHHSRGCNTTRCDQRIARKLREWHVKHPPPFHLTALETCVANQESGAPEDPYNPSHINPLMDENGYEGAFSWLPSTWERQRFPGMPSRAIRATLRQQGEVFRRYKNPGEWPTMAKC